MMSRFQEPLWARLVPWFIFVVFFLVIAYWIGVGFLAYKGLSVAVEQGPEGTGQFIGRILKGIEEGRK